MITKVKERTKNFGEVRYTIVTTTDQVEWRRTPTYWRLPCGCVNPDIWTSDELAQSECTDCGRGWKHMTTFCDMLDKQPQGAEVFVLTAAMKEPA